MTRAAPLRGGRAQYNARSGSDGNVLIVPRHACVVSSRLNGAQFRRLFDSVAAASPFAIRGARGGGGPEFPRGRLASAIGSDRPLRPPLSVRSPSSCPFLFLGIPATLPRQQISSARCRCLRRRPIWRPTIKYWSLLLLLLLLLHAAAAAVTRITR